MIALIGSARDARLAHQDEACQQDALEREQQIKDRKRRGIKRIGVKRQAGIGGDPEQKQDDMERYEREAADKTRNRVADALVPGSTREEFLFVLRDQVDVLLHRAVVLRVEGCTMGLKTLSSELALRWEKKRYGEAARVSGSDGQFQVDPT